MVEYRKVRELGRGMVGVVHEAIADDGRRVVLKTLHPVASQSPSLVARFAREAEAMRAIHHAHVMPVIDVRADRDPPFFVMPLIEGTTLVASLERQPAVPLARGLAIVHDVATALAEIHRRGLVHRDVKPGNVFIRATGDALLFDFGLMKDTTVLDGGVTKAGELLGTPAYMAPEQIRGEAVSGKTDVYSLGVVALELFLGRNPYRSSDAIECCRRHLYGAAKRLDQMLPHRVPAALGELIDAMLAKNPNERPSAAHVAARAAEVLAFAGGARDVATRVVAMTTSMRRPAGKAVTA